MLVELIESTVVPLDVEARTVDTVLSLVIAKLLGVVVSEVAELVDVVEIVVDDVRLEVLEVVLEVLVVVLVVLEQSITDVLPEKSVLISFSFHSLVRLTSQLCTTAVGAAGINMHHAHIWPVPVSTVRPHYTVSWMSSIVPE